MRVDDDPLDPDQRQPVDRMVEQRAAAEFDQRLRDRIGQWPQPGAETGGQHHRRFRHAGHAAPACTAPLSGRCRSVRRQMAVEPVGDRAQRRLAREIVFEQPPDARDVGEIGRLAVAPPQPREDADDLAVALRRQDRGGAGEGGAVEFREMTRDSARSSRRAGLPARRGGHLRAAKRDRSSPARTPRPGNRAARRRAPPTGPAAASDCRHDSRAVPASVPAERRAAGSSRQRAR